MGGYVGDSDYSGIKDEAEILSSFQNYSQSIDFAKLYDSSQKIDSVLWDAYKNQGWLTVKYILNIISTQNFPNKQSRHRYACDLFQVIKHLCKRNEPERICELFDTGYLVCRTMFDEFDSFINACIPDEKDNEATKVQKRKLLTSVVNHENRVDQTLPHYQSRIFMRRLAESGDVEAILIFMNCQYFQLNDMAKDLLAKVSFSKAARAAGDDQDEYEYALGKLSRAQCKPLLILAAHQEDQYFLAGIFQGNKNAFTLMEPVFQQVYLKDLIQNNNDGFVACFLENVGDSIKGWPPNLLAEMLYQLAKRGKFKSATLLYNSAASVVQLYIDDLGKTAFHYCVENGERGDQSRRDLFTALATFGENASEELLALKVASYVNDRLPDNAVSLVMASNDAAVFMLIMMRRGALRLTEEVIAALANMPEFFEQLKNNEGAAGAYNPNEVLDFAGLTPVQLGHALFVAIRAGDPELVTALIEAGADLAVVTHDPASRPLLYAVKHGSPKVIEAFILHVKQPKLELHPADDVGPVEKGRCIDNNNIALDFDRAFYELCASGRFVLAKALFERNAETIKCSTKASEMGSNVQSNYTAAHHCFPHKKIKDDREAVARYELVKLMVAKGKHFDPNCLLGSRRLLIALDWGDHGKLLKGLAERKNLELKKASQVWPVASGYHLHSVMRLLLQQASLRLSVNDIAALGNDLLLGAKFYTEAQDENAMKAENQEGAASASQEGIDSEPARRQFGQLLFAALSENNLGLITKYVVTKSDEDEAVAAAPVEGNEAGAEKFDLAKINLSIKTKEGFSALHYALKFSNNETIAQLLALYSDDQLVLDANTICKKDCWSEFGMLLDCLEPGSELLKKLITKVVFAYLKKIPKETFSKMLVHYPGLLKAENKENQTVFVSIIAQNRFDLLRLVLSGDDYEIDFRDSHRYLMRLYNNSHPQLLTQFVERYDGDQINADEFQDLLLQALTSVRRGFAVDTVSLVAALTKKDVRPSGERCREVLLDRFKNLTNPWGEIEAFVNGRKSILLYKDLSYLLLPYAVRDGRLALIRSILFKDGALRDEWCQEGEFKGGDVGYIEQNLQVMLDCLKGKPGNLELLALVTDYFRCVSEPWVDKPSEKNVIVLDEGNSGFVKQYTNALADFFLPRWQKVLKSKPADLANLLPLFSLYSALCSHFSVCDPRQNAGLISVQRLHPVAQAIVPKKSETPPVDQEGALLDPVDYAKILFKQSPSFDLLQCLQALLYHRLYWIDTKYGSGRWRDDLNKLMAKAQPSQQQARSAHEQEDSGADSSGSDEEKNQLYVLIKAMHECYLDICKNYHANWHLLCDELEKYLAAALKEVRDAMVLYPASTFNMPKSFKITLFHDEQEPAKPVGDDGDDYADKSTAAATTAST